MRRAYNDASLDILHMDAAHPDEEPAGEPCDALHLLLRDQPINGPFGKVESIIANEDAYNAPPDQNGLRQRMLDSNLVNTQPHPDGDKEQRRLHYLLHAAFPGRSLQLDRHGNGGNIDWAFCHPAAGALVWDVIALLGIRHVVHYGAGHLASYLPRYLGIDLGVNSPLTARTMHAKLQQLTDGYTVSYRPPVRQYADVGAIMLDQARRHGLPAHHKPFTTLPPWVTRVCGLPQNTVATLVDPKRHASTNCWGEVYLPLE